MDVLITICARGGSKGIPNKNIKLLNGLPLIAYSIECAKQFASNVNFHSDIVISTDDVKIKDEAKKLGLDTKYIRPAYLATDSSGKIDTIAHVVDYEESRLSKKYDYILDLDVSSPLRTVQDLLSAFQIIQSDDNALNLFSVNSASKNPYFNMVEKGEDGYFKLSKSISEKLKTRQSAPQVFELNASFYFYKRSFFDSTESSAITKRSIIYIMPHICFDLDQLIDFEFLEFLLSNKKLDFML